MVILYYTGVLKVSYYCCALSMHCNTADGMNVTDVINRVLLLLHCWYVWLGLGSNPSEFALVSVLSRPATFGLGKLCTSADCSIGRNCFI